ncbi:MAG TPA: endo-1,4-beta-xylanase [Gemmatimonadaceae bacterium]|nr:endo-1,4-beta-xylanase [Gemmatimonadaceae bacterium]
MKSDPHLRFIAVVIAASVGVACGGDSGSGSTAPIVPVVNADTFPLRTLAQQAGIRIGSAGDRGFRWTGTDGSTFRAILGREFSVLTPENDMKFDHLHPAQATYYFAGADSLVAFAQQNQMAVRGHTLVWHQQLPKWITSGSFGADEAAQQLIDHVTTVVSHFKGKVFAWDVVNEAFNDDGSRRSAYWLDHIGRNYIELAFRTARAADPDVALFYNDYNVEGINTKSDSVYAMVKDFLARGVPITGVGLQSHFILNGVPATLGANIARFVALGVKVHVTELDVRVPVPSTSASLATQAQNYHDVVMTCIQNKGCELVTMWGFTDKDSWVPGTFPGFGDALPWDSSFQQKPAYKSIYNALAGR